MNIELANTRLLIGMRAAFYRGTAYGILLPCRIPETTMSRAIDIMTEDPVTLPISSTVGDAVQLLRDLHIRHLPVTNDEGEVVGMLSDRDLGALTIPRTLDGDWLATFQVALDTDVAKIMSSDVISVEEEAETTEVIELMLEHKVGAIPVVDAEERLVGIVSYMDVLRELQDRERSTT